MWTAEPGGKGAPPPVAPKKGVEIVFSTSKGPDGQQSGQTGGPFGGQTTGKKIAPPTAPKPHHNQGMAYRLELLHTCVHHGLSLYYVPIFMARKLMITYK